MKKRNKEKILVIDDSQANLLLMSTHLGGMGLEVLTAESALAGINIAINDQPDLILLDIMMPDIDGFEACKRLKSDPRTQNIPVLFVSAKAHLNDKIHGLEIGAVDYITKPFNKDELKARVGTQLKLIQLQDKLQSLADSDELTGLANRRKFIEILEREILQAKIKNHTLAVLMFDLDYFKNINDTFGHQCGDSVLLQFARVLEQNIYPLDFAARYGGEEFIVMMPETSKKKAEKAAQKLCSLIEINDWNLPSDQIPITTSIGIATVDSLNKIDSNELIRRADVALYAAKRKGRNCAVRWDNVHADGMHRDDKAEDFRILQNKVTTLTSQIKTQTSGTIAAFAKALTIKDPHRINHIENMQAYTEAIADQIGLSEESKNILNTAALLHDLGKICIPNEILGKTEPLSEEDMKIIRNHPIASAQILGPIGIFERETQIIRHHHENFDGTGYPDGLIGKQIAIGARILAIANAFDCITSGSDHNPPRTYEQALMEIESCSGTQFDPDVVEAFEKACDKHKDQWPLATNNKPNQVPAETVV